MCELKAEDFENGGIDILSVLVKSGLSSSRSEARRNVEQGGVSVDTQLVNDIKTLYSKDDFKAEGKLVKRGKKSFVKVYIK